jgi:hypothetical protein
MSELYFLLALYDSTHDPCAINIAHTNDMLFHSIKRNNKYLLTYSMEQSPS